MRSLLLALIASAASAAAAGNEAIPLFFIANHGQAPPHVRYMAQGPEVTAYFSPREILFRIGSYPIRMQFQGSNPAAPIEGTDRLPGEVNFLTGPQENWRRGKAMYGSVVYRQLYSGIDMVYRGSPRFLKSEFVVAAGADPALIRIHYGNGAKPRIDVGGDLVITLDGREFREEAPFIYQVRDGASVAVDGRYRLTADGAVGFEVADYDRARPLIIDPIVYSTIFGGSSTDSITALAVDSTGAAYVAGFTTSYDLPSISPFQSASAGSNDIFVAKLNPDGSGLAFCTYVGGRGDDRAYALAIDSSGAAYVTGSTTSTAFPVRSPIQSALSGSKDAFVFKLSPVGNALVFSTYLGGSSSDVANGIAVDPTGNVFVTGDTTSANFPTTVYQRTNRGGQDAFVVKLAAAGGPMLYGTYLGGTYDDHSAAIAVDAGGTAYITGSTYSANFPLASAMQTAIGGGQDAFVARLNASGSALVYSTYLGGSSGSLGYPETGNAIAVDIQGNAYVTGSTSSTNFPLLRAAQPVRRGSMDAFIVKLNLAGSLVNSTYLGGAGVDTGNAIAIDGSGNSYIAGQTYSSDLPVASAFQSAPKGAYDAFVAKLTASGASIPFLSYLGGRGSDTATGVALDSTGSIFVAGWTQSTDFPVVNGYQSVNGGTYGGFVTKVADTLPAAVSVNPNSGSGASQTFAFQFSNNTGVAGLTTVSVLFHSSISTTGACSVTYTRATNTLQLLTDAGAAPAGAITPGSGSQQNSQCTLNGAGSSVSSLENVLTLNLSITFQVGFNGNKNIYMQANNASGSSGWQLRGSWSVASGPPSVISVSPSSGSGDRQTFSFLVSDPRGFEALTSVSVIIRPSTSTSSVCSLYYGRAANTIYLLNDAGTAWLTPAVLGSATTIQNSRCTVYPANSTVSGSGNNLTLNLALSFKAVFAGAKNIYMEAFDGLDSGWQLKGTWNVVDSGPPWPLSVTPGSGSGSTQTFTFVYTDPRGYAALNTVSALIGSSQAAAGACYIYYAAAQNAIYLANDAGTNWSTAGVLGSGTTLSNSQCTVNPATSSVSGAGNNLTLNVAFTFKPSFGGSRNIYMSAYDGTDSGWLQKGTWTVPSILSPVSVTPNSGSGISQTFAFLFTDPAGYASIMSASMIIGSGSAGTCSFYYARASNTIYLSNDASTGWLAPGTLGSAGTLQNSQCALNLAASSAVGSGSNLTVNLALTFKPAYTGSKPIHMEVYNGTDSGWFQRGTWIVP
jgi:beta-propeller repeat-containing protein